MNTVSAENDNVGIEDGSWSSEGVGELQTGSNRSEIYLGQT